MHLTCWNHQTLQFSILQWLHSLLTSQKPCKVSHTTFMASFRPSWLCSLNIIFPTKPTFLPSTNLSIAACFKPIKIFHALNPDNAESAEPTSSNSPEIMAEAQPGPVDPVKLAFAKAKAYKKSQNSKLDLKIEQGPAGNLDKEENGKDEYGFADGGQKEVPVSVKVAMEKAKKYKDNKGVLVSDNTINRNDTIQGEQGGIEETLSSNVMDSAVGKKGELSVSRMDFMGLDFADKKKTRGLPPGLVPISDPFSEGDLPEVEIIVGDTSKFDAATTPKTEQDKEDESDLYKPKVSTWGVFPRPGNISKTFGGGRNIRPGEVLETAEERAAKDARTKQLLAAYKKKVGLSIDVKQKSECEKELKDGDLLMDAGKLKEALPYYEKVMDKLTFQSELHGLAALQWSICQDSLSRSSEARLMYEKLQSHPSPKVRKKARQFMFSFQAMEMMKVTTGSPFSFKNTGYQNYFDAFIENKESHSPEGETIQESGMNQVLLYVFFLVSPIFLVLFFAVQKRI